MAFHSLRKWFLTFRKAPYVNYIQQFRQYLYQQWYSSLSEQERLAEDERIKRIEQRKYNDAKMLINLLSETLEITTRQSSWLSR